MAYASWSVIAGEQPTTAKWNILGTNDAAFNNGSGLPTAASATATVATNESTNSGSYTDLATTTDTVTVTIGASGMALVLVEAVGDCTTSGITLNMSVALSGANTVAAGAGGTPIAQYSTVSTVNIGNGFSAFALMTGLTAGSTTFKAKYASGGGISGFFASRRVVVIPF